MPRYVIISPKVGTPGEPYDPPVWVNLHALVAGGFIRRVDSVDTVQADTDEPAPAPTRVKRKKSPDTGPKDPANG